MSELRFDTIQDTSGGQSSTADQLLNGREKAWVNFNGQGTVAIRGSFGVNSITDNGVGDFTVNFSTAFSSYNYSVSHGCGQNTIAWGEFILHDTVDPTSTTMRFLNSASNADSNVDTKFMCLAFNGNV